MTKETMTIHEALSELKTIDKRIEKKIEEFTPCVANRNNNYKIGGVTREEFQKKAADDYKSICALIDRRDAIKKAVSYSNAVTKVTVCGKEYSVAEAIYMNNNGTALKLLLIQKISRAYNKATDMCDSENLSVADDAAEFVSKMYNGGEKITKSKDVNLLKEQESYIEKNTWSILQGINCLDEMEKLEKETSEFISKVNSALSISNAITEIEVEY